MSVPSDYLFNNILKQYTSAVEFRIHLRLMKIVLFYWVTSVAETVVMFITVFLESFHVVSYSLSNVSSKIWSMEMKRRCSACIGRVLGSNHGFRLGHDHCIHMVYLMTLSSSNYIVLNAGLLVNWQGCSFSGAVLAVVKSNRRNPRNPLRPGGLPQSAYALNCKNEYRTFG